MVRSIKDRNVLVELHLTLAEDLARHRSRSVSSTVQYDELLSAAYLGLIDAAERFEERLANEKSSNPFKTYARQRINGEMNDYLRSCHWGTRTNPLRMMSIEQSAYRQRYDVDRNSTIAEKVCNNDIDIIDLLNSKELFDKIVRCLPKREQYIFRLRYLYDLTMKQVADTLNISESRVSQILSQNTKYLREVWSNRSDELWNEVISLN